MPPIDRPLRLGEVLAETAHVYANRLWAALGLGGFLAAVIALASVVPDVANLLLVALGFTACYAAASRVVSGDHFREAFAQVALRLPVLLVLTVVVSVPLALALSDVLVLLFGVAWLALTGFSIPVAMLERGEDGDSWFRRLGYTVTRSVNLARVEYLHAVGVSAALAILYVFVGSLLASALVGFADDSGFVAFLLVQVVLSPFFFLGLAVLYFEQKARALSSPEKPVTRGNDADVRDPVQPE